MSEKKNNNDGGFTDVIKTRITKKMHIKIKKILNKDEGEKFGGESHFVRCAIIEKIRKESTNKEVK